PLPRGALATGDAAGQENLQRAPCAFATGLDGGRRVASTRPRHVTDWQTRLGARELAGHKGRHWKTSNRKNALQLRAVDRIFYLLPPVHVKDAKHAALWEPPYDFGAHFRTCLCRGEVG